MTASRTKYTILNSAFGFLVRIITLLAAFVTRSIFIRTLGIQYAGLSGVFTDILVVLSFAELGIGSAIVYALYKPIAENDQVQIAKLMGVFRKVYTYIACVIISLGVLLIPFLPYIITGVPDIKEDIRLIYLLYVLSSASSYVLIYKSTFLTAAQKDYIVSKSKIFISLAKAVAECIILLLTRNFILYLVVTIAFNIIQNYYIAVVAEREYPILKEKSTLGLTKEERSSMFKNVRALFLYKVSGVVLNGTSSIITSAFLGTIWVGMLSNYIMISNQLYAIIMILFTATSASIGNLAATSTNIHQLEVFNKMHFLCFWIYSFSATALYIIFNPFINIWLGNDFVLDDFVVIAIVVEFYIRGMLSPISQFRTSNGLFVQGQFRPIIMALLNIVIAIYLAPKIGLVGILLGSIIARALTQLWYDPWLIYKKVFHISSIKFAKKYLEFGILTVLSCAVSKLVFNNIQTNNDILNILIGILIVFLIPNFIIVLFYHKTHEFIYLKSLVVNMLKNKKL